MKTRRKTMKLTTFGMYLDFVEQHRSEDGLVAAVGLGGEAGEVLNELKKMHRDDGGLWTKARRKKVALELGDTLYYLALIAWEAGYTLHDIAIMNVEKLKRRAEKKGR
jgi:NTP pyrophosphatase (non-canonical NTP hydrolase)